MRPLLGVPVLRESEPVMSLIESVRDEARVLVIDNSEGNIDWSQRDLPDDAWLVQPYRNLGCAGSWNEIARSALLTDPYVLVANADTVLAPGAIRYVSEECEKGGPRWVGIDGDWRLFGLTAEAVETVGWFDADRFYPIYNEDCDYEHRCRVAGVPFYHHHRTGSTHGSGLSWKGSDQRASENSRTHRANNEMYVRKWGGPVRGGEAFATPFDQGQPDLCGPLLSRLRSQTWRD
jgi:GT2 family glycosyltransferase